MYDSRRPDSPQAYFYGKDEVEYAWDELWPILAEINLFQGTKREYPLDKVPEMLNSICMKQIDGKGKAVMMILRHDLGKHTKEDLKRIYNMDGAESIVYAIYRNHQHDEYDTSEKVLPFIADINGKKLPLSGKILY